MGLCTIWKGGLEYGTVSTGCLDACAVGHEFTLILLYPNLCSALHDLLPQRPQVCPQFTPLEAAQESLPSTRRVFRVFRG